MDRSEFTSNFHNCAPIFACRLLVSQRGSCLSRASRCEGLRHSSTVPHTRPLAAARIASYDPSMIPMALCNFTYSKHNLHLYTYCDPCIISALTSSGSAAGPWSTGCAVPGTPQAASGGGGRGSWSQATACCSGTPTAYRGHGHSSSPKPDSPLNIGVMEVQCYVYIYIYIYRYIYIYIYIYTCISHVTHLEVVLTMTHIRPILLRPRSPELRDAETGRCSPSGHRPE